VPPSPLMHLLVLVPLPVPIHNILLSRSSKEESLSMFSSKDQALSARLVKRLRSNTPVLLPPTEKFSIHLFQEVSQLLSPSET
jgi:hypothetical protein